MRATRAAAALGAALLLGACVGVDATSSMGGRWVSTFSSEYVGLVLEQDDERVSGSAELMPGGVRTTYRVRGTAEGENLDLVLEPEGTGGPVTLAGSLQGDTLAILLDGGGFSQRFVPLVRE